MCDCRTHVLRHACWTLKVEGRIVATLLLTASRLTAEQVPQPQPPEFHLLWRQGRGSRRRPWERVNAVQTRRRRPYEFTCGCGSSQPPPPSSSRATGGVVFCLRTSYKLQVSPYKFRFVLQVTRTRHGIASYSRRSPWTGAFGSRETRSVTSGACQIERKGLSIIKYTALHKNPRKVLSSSKFRTSRPVEAQNQGTTQSSCFGILQKWWPRRD